MTFYIGQTVRCGKRRAVVLNTYTYVGDSRTYKGPHTHATLRIGKRTVSGLPFTKLTPKY